MSTIENTQSEIPPATEAAGRDTKVKAVLFDLGETLLNFGKISTTSIFTEGARLSYDYLKSLNQHICGFKWYFCRNLVNLRIQRWISKIKDRDFDSLKLLEKVGAKKGIELTAEQWRRFGWLWYEPLSKICRSEPDVRETLTTLRDAGIKLGILSNTFVHRSCLEKHLEQLGILEFFTIRVYSYEFAFRKPDARIFKIAAERIGESPENILFVGDRIDKDIVPAMRQGMFAILKEAYTNAGEKIPPGARKIRQISELPSLIKEINGELVGAR